MYRMDGDPIVSGNRALAQWEHFAHEAGVYERFRPDRALMDLPQLDARTGLLRSLELVLLRVHRLQLEEAAAQDARWLAEALDGESRGGGARVRADGNGIPTVAW